EVLFDLGAIGFDDLAAELDAAIAEVMLSPMGQRPLDEITLVARGSDERAAGARRVLVARGVLWASGLDARRRAATSGPRSLQEVARALFARAAATNTSTWSLTQLADEVATACG